LIWFTICLKYWFFSKQLAQYTSRTRLKAVRLDRKLLTAEI
jgi:hypothetical protein